MIIELMHLGTKFEEYEGKRGKVSGYVANCVDADGQLDQFFRLKVERMDQLKPQEVLRVKPTRLFFMKSGSVAVEGEINPKLPAK